MLDIFLIFEIVYEIWNLLHFISDADEMNRFRIFSFHAEGSSLRVCIGKMRKNVQL